MKQTNPLWLTILLIIIFLTAGILIGRFNKQAAQITQIKQEISEHAQLFNSKSAEISGKITALDGNTATIQSDNGQSAKFNLAQQIYITKYDLNNKPTYSTNKSDLQLNKEAVINLTLPKGATILENSDAMFEVTSLTYLPSAK